MIFNSLGSNYSFAFAWKFLRARVSANSDEKLKGVLSEKYGGEAWLYYKGRAALMEAIRLSGEKRVFTSSFSCYAVEQAIDAADATPVFVDIARGRFHFGLKQLKIAHQANPGSGVVILQNSFGIGGKVKPIQRYCRRHGLRIIEDLAHCPVGRYEDGLAFGSIGESVVLSFARDKQIDVVNGGALIVRDSAAARKVEPPQVVIGHYYQRAADRLYPLLISWIRACHRLRLSGALWYKIFNSLGLLTLANDGAPFYGGALPGYRSAFILEQFENLKSDQARRHHLARLYGDCLPARRRLAEEQVLLRYPILLTSARARQYLFEALRRQHFRLEETWYDNLVHPPRFTELSAYTPGSCENKEQATKRIINLPLHKQVDSSQARAIGTVVSAYVGLRFKRKFTQQAWEQACRQFAPELRNLLISWEEGEAYKKLGTKLWRIAAVRDGRVVALAAAVLVGARRGRYLKLAGNPLFATADATAQAGLIRYLKQIAVQERCSFIRMQPYLTDLEENRRFMRELGFKPAPASLNAPHTLKVDLDRPLEKILASKHYSSTRYNINKARRTGIRVVEDNSQRSLAEFLELLRLTQATQGFLSNPFEFIKSQFRTYAKTGRVHIYKALAPVGTPAGDRPLAMAFVIDADSETAYLYGASSHEGQKMKAVYLLQWQIIEAAHGRGMKTYNLWGVAPPHAPDNHRFARLSKFKRNFTSEYYAYLPAYDLVLKRPAYLPLYLLEKYEAKRKHL